MFIGLNRNKKSVTLDLGRPESREIKRRLIGSADVVVANLPAPVLRKLELDYDSLAAINPTSFSLRFPPSAPEGPYANRVGFDPVAQAMSGAMGVTGFPGAPVRSVVPFEDFGTALHAAFGTMVALYERQKTGRGQIVEASLLADRCDVHADAARRALRHPASNAGSKATRPFTSRRPTLIGRKTAGSSFT